MHIDLYLAPEEDPDPVGELIELLRESGFDPEAGGVNPTSHEETIRCELTSALFDPLRDAIQQWQTQNLNRRASPNEIKLTGLPEESHPITITIHPASSRATAG
jgi:hypothetical protein